MEVTKAVESYGQSSDSLFSLVVEHLLCKQKH